MTISIATEMATNMIMYLHYPNILDALFTFTSLHMYILNCLAVAEYTCYHYTLDEKDMFTNQGKTEEEVCSKSGNVFTGGKFSLPGCGSCWCCTPQKAEISTTRPSRITFYKSVN